MAEVLDYDLVVSSNSSRAIRFTFGKSMNPPYSPSYYLNRIAAVFNKDSFGSE